MQKTRIYETLESTAEGMEGEILQTVRNKEALFQRYAMT